MFVCYFPNAAQVWQLQRWYIGAGWRNTASGDSPYTDETGVQLVGFFFQEPGPLAWGEGLGEVGGWKPSEAPQRVIFVLIASPLHKWGE